MNEKIKQPITCNENKGGKKLMNSGYISKVQPRRHLDVTGQKER